MEIISLIASIVSVIIGGFAIWLSVTFYRMSINSSEDIKKSSNQIDSTVTRLETLFDKLYSDTFSIMKDTVTDMRKHVWNPSDVKQPPEIDNSIREQLNKQIEQILSSQKGTELRLHNLQNQLQDALLKTVKEATNKEAQRLVSHVGNTVLVILRSQGPLTLIQLSKKYNIEQGSLVAALFDLARKGLVTWDHAPNQLGPEEVIKAL
jgi:uncharacterized membrane-anchored protein YhcB (DUF1043 family)